jgi:TPR repeat protein
VKPALLLALLLACGGALADASDDYLAGLRAIEAGQTSRGLYLLEQAALGGLLDAQYRFGELTPGQPGERWLRTAVRGGSLPAAEVLAQRYYDQAEYRRAAQCWLLAAGQGSSSAQARLGALQVVGYGLPRDRVQAYAWLNLAASAGDADVLALRDKLGEQLDPAQIVSGEALSRELPQKLPQLLGEPPCGE